MATQDRWNIHGRQWLATLEEMDAEAESPDEELTTFERNLMAELRTMVVKPEDEPSPPEGPIYVQIEGAFAQYIREMANNNGVSLTDYTHDLLGKGIAADKKTSAKPDPTAEEHGRIASFRQRAHDFFVDHLDENEWDIDSNPMVSLSDHGAYVQLWKWFSDEDDE
jgi:hypothetical protein